MWDRFVAECPLAYVSPNAPGKSEVLGTILFSVLSGHRHYAHITGIRSDGVLPKLLGIKRFRSEDSIRRAFEKQDEDELTLWMDRQMDITYSALLRYEWGLDLDATVAGKGTDRGVWRAGWRQMSYSSCPVALSACVIVASGRSRVRGASFNRTAP